MATNIKTNSKTFSEKMQDILGTTSRNKAILALFEAGMKKSEIARQFTTVRGHTMSPQHVGKIITMMQKAKENHHGDDAVIRK